MSPNALTSAPLTRIDVTSQLIYKGGRLGQNRCLPYMEEHKIIIVLPWATPFGIHTPSVENLQILVNKIE